MPMRYYPPEIWQAIIMSDDGAPVSAADSGHNVVVVDDDAA